jgi:hypothetical protein
VHDPEKHWPVFGKDHAPRKITMRITYMIVVVLALAAVVFDHLSSASSGRAVSPEDFIGACAPCGAPCPSTK